MSPQIGLNFWLLIAIGCSLVPCVTPCNRGLPFLPEELASIVKQMSYDAGWAVSAAYVNSKDHVDKNTALLRNRAETLKKKSVGLLSAKAVDDLKDMLWNVASYIIWGQEKYKTKAEEKAAAIAWQNAVSYLLIKNITEMARHTAWCTLNKNMGNSQRCDTVDVHNVEFYYNKIRGTPRVRGIVFHKDHPLKIGSPLEDADIERVDNPGPEPITLKRTYTERHGRTTSVSRSMQFSAKVSAGFNFGFSMFGVEAGTSFSFETSTQSSTTFMGEIMKETTVQREYTFTVAPGESAIISVKQGQLDLRLRYTVELDFDGFVKNMTGIWEGSANSNIEVSYIPLN